MSDDIAKYNAWRITFQDAEKAAQAAFADGLACRREIAALRKALSEIAEWTDRYTSPGHPVSTVAKRALTGQ